MISSSGIQIIFGLILIIMQSSSESPQNHTGFVLIYDRNKRNYESSRREKLKQQINSIANEFPVSEMFLTKNCTIITSQLSGIAELPCSLRKSATGVVSWIRRNDLNLLTVGVATFSADDRFFVEHIRHLNNWSLKIRNVQMTDKGFYECQLASYPPTRILLELKVIEPSAKILGSPELFVNIGSLLRLVCVLPFSTKLPTYVFWYHNNQMVIVSENKNLSIETQQFSSILTITVIDKSDNGNYTCLPSNTKSAHINVHLLNTTAGDQAAAMHHANTNRASNLCTLFWIMLIVSVMIR